MTRFARAKGSKASNERKPEEATSWSELKKSVLLKQKEEIKEHSQEDTLKADDGCKQTEWASLGDDNVSLLKEHSKLKNKKGESGEMVEEKKKVKKRKCVINSNEGSKGSVMSKEGKKKMKKRKLLNSEQGEEKVQKKGKKRKINGENSGEPKRKKKGGIASKSVYSNKGNEFEEREVHQCLNKGAGGKISEKRGGKGPFEVMGNKWRKENVKLRNKRTEEVSSSVEELIINGEKIKIVKFQGFNVTLEDAERLRALRSEMMKEGIPRDKLEAAIKLERRRAEKALSRLKKSVCFHCRGHGHLLSNCPNLEEKETTGTGICYKCGSTEHSAGECKVVKGSKFSFAECFICKEQGHIARQCPDNPRGLYPRGGACRECGDVTHLRKDCPQVLSQKEEEAVTVELRNERNLECLDEEIAKKERRETKKGKKKATVRF